MMGNFKENTRIKIISLLSALVLWMYVMAVVNPLDTKLYENIPITITNLNEIRDLDLVIDSQEQLVASAYVKGTLSDLQKITKGNIDVYGVINNPIEGKNQLHLRATTSQQVTVNLKSNVIAINLEKKISTDKKIDVDVKGKYKHDIDKINLDKEIVKVTGARSKVDAVKYIRADLNVNKQLSGEFTRELALRPLDANLKEVNDVELSYTKVKANVTLLKTKNVKVNVLFKDKKIKFKQGTDYSVSPENIEIKGSNDLIEKINSIDTIPVDIQDFDSNSKIVNLSLPEGVTSNVNKVTVTIPKLNIVNDVFSYEPNEIEIINNTVKIDKVQKVNNEEINNTDIDNNKNETEDITLNKFNLPEVIKVTVRYNEKSKELLKDDIKLYIDLSNKFIPNTKYYIKYNTNTDIKNIDIEPSYIESK